VCKSSKLATFYKHLVIENESLWYSYNFETKEENVFSNVFTPKVRTVTFKLKKLRCWSNVSEALPITN